MPIYTDSEMFKLSIQYVNYDMRVLKYCFEAKSRKEVMEYLGVSSQTKNYEKYFEPLLVKSLKELTLPD
jgi:hypothetical protein